MPIKAKKTETKKPDGRALRWQRHREERDARLATSKEKAERIANSLSAAATVPQQQLTVALKLGDRIDSLRRELAELEALRDLATKYDLI